MSRLITFESTPFPSLGPSLAFPRLAIGIQEFAYLPSFHVNGDMKKTIPILNSMIYVCRVMHLEPTHSTISGVYSRLESRQ